MTISFGTWTFREYSLDDKMLAEARAAGIDPIRFINNDGSVPVTSEDARICVVDCQTPFKRGQGHRAECEKRDAHARLIAAAPDMFEALEGLLFVCDIMELNSFPRSLREAMDASRAALAKAKGEK
jgi:hypothetical protein